MGDSHDELDDALDQGVAILVRVSNLIEAYFDALDHGATSAACVIQTELLSVAPNMRGAAALIERRRG